MISKSKVFQEASQEKVKLKEDLLMPVLLKLLFKEAVINKETYFKALKEVKRYDATSVS